MFYWRWFNRPRNPLIQLLIGALGLVLLAGVLTLGFVALLAFAVVGGIVALVRAVGHHANSPRPAARAANVIDGEFVVLPNRTASPIER